jgi:hypothetical protein
VLRFTFETAVLPGSPDSHFYFLEALTTSPREKFLRLCSRLIATALWDA